MFRELRRRCELLRDTPLHPQWLAGRHEKRMLSIIAKTVRGLVLDIGCGRQVIRQRLGADTTYLGLDYYETATDWYNTRPDVYGNAQILPIRARSVDHVLLLDVLEHLPVPMQCIAEIARVLKPGGTLLVQVPFFYPIHDAPLDFQRWTGFGLKHLMEGAGFRQCSLRAIGQPFESAALAANLAASAAVLQWIERRSPLALTVFALPFFVIISNLAGWLLAHLTPRTELMPTAYFSEWQTSVA